MKEIKLEVQKLVKLLDNIKKNHSNFIDSEINKTINECVGIENSEETENVDYLSDSFKQLLSSKGNRNLHSFQKDLIEQYQSVLDITINLNKLLDKPIKKIQSMEEIKHKSLLSVNDVSLLFGFSKSQQQNFRGRLQNPLPCHKESTQSKSSNTKIYYKKEELDHWIENFL